MAYEKTNWVNDQTPLNQVNLNKIEEGVKDAHDNIDQHELEIDNVKDTVYNDHAERISLNESRIEDINLKEDKEDVVFQATSLTSLTPEQKSAIVTQIDDVLTNGEIDKEKFKNFILEITLTGDKYYYQCVQYSMINGIATLYFTSSQTKGILKLYVEDRKSVV